LFFLLFGVFDDEEREREKNEQYREQYRAEKEEANPEQKCQRRETDGERGDFPPLFGGFDGKIRVPCRADCAQQVENKKYPAYPYEILRVVHGFPLCGKKTKCERLKNPSWVRRMRSEQNGLSGFRRGGVGNSLPQNRTHLRVRVLPPIRHGICQIVQECAADVGMLGAEFP